MKEMNKKEEKPWGELEKKKKLGWIALIFILAIAIVGICIVQGVTSEEFIADGELELSVLQLEEAYKEIEDEPAFYQGEFSEFSDVNESLKEPELIQDEEGIIYSVVYERAEDGTFSVIGNYPLVEQDLAKQWLDEGRYFTKAPGDFPGQDAVIKGELLYRDDGSRLMIPYYRFWVELPQEETKAKEQKCYGAFYVPAVETEYLDNLSIWHESE